MLSARATGTYALTESKHDCYIRAILCAIEAVETDHNLV